MIKQITIEVDYWPSPKNPEASFSLYKWTNPGSRTAIFSGTYHECVILSAAFIQIGFTVVPPVPAN